jgi:hypothetical protein
MNETIVYTKKTNFQKLEWQSAEIGLAFFALSVILYSFGGIFLFLSSVSLFISGIYYGIKTAKVFRC